MVIKLELSLYGNTIIIKIIGVFTEIYHYIIFNPLGKKTVLAGKTI